MGSGCQDTKSLYTTLFRNENEWDALGGLVYV